VLSSHVLGAPAARYRQAIPPHAKPDRLQSSMPPQRSDRGVGRFVCNHRVFNSVSRIPTHCQGKSPDDAARPGV